MCCVKWGVIESIRSESELEEKFKSMDTYINSMNKIRLSIKGDGHCLPRAIFRGAKHLNLIPQFITYTQLLRSSVEKIKANIQSDVTPPENTCYKDFITEGVDKAIEALDTYEKSKKYNLPSNIIDIVMFALSNETSCLIKVHYQERGGSFDTHNITPNTAISGVVEVAFINAHYDLVIKKHNVLMKQEHRTDVNMEQCELEDDNGNEGNIHRTADESVDDENGYDIEDQYRTHSEDGSDNLSTVIFPTLYFSICLCLSVCLSMSIFLLGCLSTVCCSVCLFVCCSACLSVCLSSCLSIRLLVCLLAYPHLVIYIFLTC